MEQFQSASLRALSRLEPNIINAVREKLASDGLPDRFKGRGFVERAMKSFVHGPTRAIVSEGAGPNGGSPVQRRGNMVMEAIVLTKVRPPLLVRAGTFVAPAEADTVPEVLAQIAGFNRGNIDPGIAITGRVEFGNVPGTPYVGTGWIVDKPAATRAVVVTNRHVASTFAAADGRGAYPIRLLPNFAEYSVNLDFIEEHEVAAEQVARVSKVLFIAGVSSADMALLEVEGDVLTAARPLAMAAASPKEGDQIGVIGYPAYDSRNDANELLEYFGDIFDVKRFSFGNVTSVTAGKPEFTHDATTLGGNSGSLVLNRDSGEAVGLHFAGEYLVANYAVPVSEIKAALSGLNSMSVVASSAPTEAAGDGLSKIGEFKGRDGYVEAFLGRNLHLKPPLPGANWKEDLTDITDADTGGTGKELKYRHFSVWMCSSRKLPLMTAVNIDGGLAKRLGRTDKWFVDGRLGKEFQVDNAAYVRNPLDRGHMVRREDPVWGELEAAAQANKDSFHYTNAAPQHEDLNQKDWVNLKDYVLGNAKTHGLKVSVFTGPVFQDDDPEYRGIVRLPRSFWKIAAIVDSQTQKLSVTGYILGQGDLIKGLTGEFVYGAFRTYQVEVAEIGRLARLEVGHLAAHDPLALRRRTEGLDANTGRFVVVNGGADLVL